MAKSVFEQIVDRSIVTLSQDDLRGVKNIGLYAFRNCSKLTDINMPNSVTLIGNYSFAGCSKLASVVMTDSVTRIGNSAFASCTALTNITLSENLTEIGVQAFQSAGLTSITIPSKVAVINPLAFSNTLSTSALTSIRFEQPLGMSVTLPQAGNGNGAFYSKSAKAISVYTDNETIKNYNWSADNRTATIYHLDGTLWE